MQSKSLSFQNPAGQRLAARLDLPADGRPLAYALFAHCFTCSKNLKAAANVCRSLAGAGFAVLRFDFTGLGESGGDFADTNFSSNVADLLAAAQRLAADYQAPRLLVGHSLGGAAVLQAAARIPSALAVATIGAPAEPSHVLRLLHSHREAIERDGEAEVELAGRTFRIKKQFLDDLAGQRMDEVLKNLNRALLIFHAPLDDTVGIDNAGRLFQAARHPKSFVSLDRADHLLTREEDSRYVGEVLAAWAGRYIPLSREAPRQAEEGNRVVVRTEQGGFRSEVMVRGHALVADEPVSVPGGTDAGPTPYDLLVAGLGACTTMTVHMYAQRKGWPLEAATARLSHQKIHADDCTGCETRQGYIDHIDRELELTGPLDAEQRRKLLEIAEKCPVHRTLHAEVVVNTRLKE
ncbi:MAG: bifunctional alpha/beta hydrolase/OsmC family protein [Pseudomonadota bacterium]|nr:bifunctional alpha/beta hydrolase/OsmC family protein [Pseudomonadota bacterium]